MLHRRSMRGEAVQGYKGGPQKRAQRAAGKTHLVPLPVSCLRTQIPSDEGTAPERGPAVGWLPIHQANGEGREARALACAFLILSTRASEDVCRKLRSLETVVLAGSLPSNGP